jgi:2-polyprenyl-3-methyl-5-hydroxy-6-metoxy-1,4-benzoquinol methylase
MSYNKNTIDWSDNAVILTKSPLTKFYRDLMVKKLKFFKIIKNKDSSILEVGCGFGYFLNYLHDKGYKNLHGIDPDEQLLNQVPKQIKTSLQFAQKTNLESNSFDVVFIYCVLHHMGDGTKDKDYLEAIDEAMRILKPKGYIFICEPGRYKTYRVMEYIVKMLGLFSKLFKSYDSILMEEKILVHYFLKNHHKIRDRLREKKINEIINTYKLEKWLYVCQKSG